MFWGRPQPEQGRGLGWCRDRCLQTPSHPPAPTPPRAVAFHTTFCAQHVGGEEAHKGNQYHLEVPCSEPPRLAEGSVRSFGTRDKSKTVTHEA